MGEEYPLEDLARDLSICGAALCFYQAERVPTLSAKFNDKSQHELITMAIKEWASSDINKKARYLKLVEKMGLARPIKSRSYQNASNSRRNYDANTVSLTEVLKREPKKPPKNGYSLFTSEQLAKYVNVEPQKRMAEVARIWKQVISEDEKAGFDARNKEMLAQYQRDLNDFIASLTPAERHAYEEYKNSKSRSKKNKASY
ncbi:uncharacterized protein LOC141851236 isoform X2 [Brevipalpus obovatus]|uniref:uncharacterized protein LOC141851236 isoform X2 n=1 Tax=Brevipalpus obovatus TaxID=246614 RepID=UPI003D9EE005